MYKCRHCGAKISRLNKDTCPLCGGRFPLEGMEDETRDLTQTLATIDVSDIKVHSRITAMLLAFFLGFFGINEFYLGYKRAGIVLISCSVVVITASVLLYLFLHHNVLFLIIPLVLYELLLVIQGLSYLRVGVKDASGELLR